MEKLFVIKIGGNVIDNPAELDLFLADFASIPGKKLLVHGGGKIATELSSKLGIESQLVNGRRITDAETLKIVTMVYGGLVNKTVVASLQALQVNAIGLSGADANIISAHKRISPGLDYGFVGDIDSVNSGILDIFLRQDLVPVIAPLSHDGSGSMLNTNADTMASALAVALSGLYSVTLVYCFEKKGVLRNVEDEDSVIANISSGEFTSLADTGIIARGMIPKMENSFAALRSGVNSVIIAHARSLKSISSGEISGTRLSL